MKLKFLVQSLEQELAILVDSDNQALVWPKNKLPENITVGQFVYFDINNNSANSLSANNDNSLSVTELLNQILKI